MLLQFQPSILCSVLSGSREGPRLQIGGQKTFSAKGQMVRNAAMAGLPAFVAAAQFCCGNIQQPRKYVKEWE